MTSLANILPPWQPQTLVMLTLSLTLTSGTYLGWDSQENSAGLSKKSNQANMKRYGPAFKNDHDVSRYLKMYGMEMMLWRCRNAIQPYWDWKPLPVVELYCEAIGRLKSVEWFHNGQKLEVGGRYGQQIIPHYANGKYFAKWIDFRLKIYNATASDSGIYAFQVRSPSGHMEEQYIYVDISEKKKKKRRRQYNHKKKLRGRKRKGELMKYDPK
jgi:hypothetical protein